jgi:hypothetical protein
LDAAASEPSPIYQIPVLAISPSVAYVHTSDECSSAEEYYHVAMHAETTRCTANVVLES